MQWITRFACCSVPCRWRGEGTTRSPLHFLVSKSIMLITFTGRKTGNRYTTPISYLPEGDTVTVFTHAP